jgi:electron transfer flavoprotein alpha subunit
MVLVVAETLDGRLKKSSLETVYYGSKAAELLGSGCNALILGPCADGSKLGSYGAKEIWHVDDPKLTAFDSQVFTHIISGIAGEKGVSLLILADSSNGRSLLGRLSIALKAGAVKGVNKLPELKEGKLHFNRPVFSGKAFASCRVNTSVSVISLMGNTLKPVAEGMEQTPIAMQIQIRESKTKVLTVKRTAGITPLPEAQIVVSAGRGLKDPSNWPIIEELAEVLGATTACSRPVADSGWRPHSEHVGQTGIAIRPNLYIAIGISGAIQHLAGVNSSKVIVVINKDPEAPFFKAADYGVKGDLFEVVPKLTEALKRFKSTHH